MLPKTGAGRMGNCSNKGRGNLDVVEKKEYKWQVAHTDRQPPEAIELETPLNWWFVHFSTPGADSVTSNCLFPPLSTESLSSNAFPRDN